MDTHCVCHDHRYHDDTDTLRYADAQDGTNGSYRNAENDQGEHMKQYQLGCKSYLTLANLTLPKSYFTER